MKYFKPIFLLFIFSFPLVSAQFAEQRKNFETYQGYFDFYYDEKTDKIYLEVDALGENVLVRQFIE